MLLSSYPLPQYSSAPWQGDGAFSGDLATKQPSSADFYNSLNSQRVRLSSIYFSFYPASKGSSICRQYLALPDKLHLYRLIQTQAINTRRLCTDCRHTLPVPLPGQTFLQAFGKIPPGILVLPQVCALPRLRWDRIWELWLVSCECGCNSGADHLASPFYTYMVSALWIK